MSLILLFIFISAAAVQFIYWTIFASGILGHKNADQVSDKLDEGVSIIVCAHNEYENLKSLLPALLSQSFDKLELVVVNDRSTDGTYEFLLEESKKVQSLKVVNVEKTPDHVDSKKYALFLGIKAASNDKLLFTDGDCIPNSDNWVLEMNKAFDKDTNFVLGYSQFKKEGGFINALSRFETQMTGMLYLSLAKMGKPYMGVGRNMGYRKSTFLENKGFHGIQHVTGGDDDLLVNKFASASNTSLSIGTDTLVWSKSKQGIAEYFRQKIRHISVSKHYRKRDKLVLGIYSASHILFWIAFIILAGLIQFPELVYGMLAFRLIFNSLIVYGTSKKLGERIDIWLIPIMDCIFSVYLIVMGIATVSTKKVKWT